MNYKSIIIIVILVVSILLTLFYNILKGGEKIIKNRVSYIDSVYEELSR